MANWSLVGPFPYKSKVPSDWANDLDTYLTKVPNWMDGSDHTTSGSVILRGGQLYVVDDFRADSARITITTGKSLTVNSGGAVVFGGAVEVEFSAPRAYDANIKGVQGFNPAEWGSGLGYFDQHTPPNSGGSQTAIPWILDVPPGATITAIYARVDPSSAHGALPGVLPSLIVQEHDPATGTNSTVTNIADGSGSVPAYEAAHDISATGLSHTTVPGTIVYAFAYGEKGANEVAGLRFYPPRVEYTMDGMVYP